VLLARVEERTAHLLHVRGESPASRVRASGITRRVPQALAVAWAVQLGRGAWLLPARRESARRWAQVMLPGADAATRDRLARRHLVELAVQSELYWHVPDVVGNPAVVEGGEHLDAALAQGRGAIVALSHVGPMTAALAALGARQGRIYAVRQAGNYSGVVTGDEGRWTKYQRQVVEDAGVRLLSRGGVFGALQALLARGEVVLVAWDVPGRRPVAWLGQEMQLSGGVPNLAGATGAPVVPALAVRDRWRVRVLLAPALAADDPDLPRRVAESAETALRTRLPQLQEHVLLTARRRR
jgi:KDO2-lipid IV(A) lauroyltransferase